MGQAACPRAAGCLRRLRTTCGGVSDGAKALRAYSIAGAADLCAAGLALAGLRGPGHERGGVAATRGPRRLCGDVSARGVILELAQLSGPRAKPDSPPDGDGRGEHGKLGQLTDPTTRRRGCAGAGQHSGGPSPAARCECEPNNWRGGGNGVAAAAGDMGAGRGCRGAGGAGRGRKP